MKAEITYPNKQGREQILSSVKPAVLEKVAQAGMKPANLLFEGDNLPILQHLLQQRNLAGAVDLIYIDPPFATNNIFRVGKDRTATVSAPETDTVAYVDDLHGEDYLEYLRQRLIFLCEFLSARGSIYLHIDCKIGHYVKIIMDEIFGFHNFRNDITRIKCNPKNFTRKGFSNIHDMVLFYTKSDKFIWNEPRSQKSQEQMKKLFPKVDSQGRHYTTNPLHAPGETKNGATGQSWRGRFPPPGRHWRCSPQELDVLERNGLIEWSKNGNPRKIIFADQNEEKRIQDIWEFKDTPYPEYPTQKNNEMLRMIVNTSSLPGSIVLDCFSGSGTSLAAAQQLGRHWIGIDRSPSAIQTTLRWLEPIEEAEYIYMKQIFPPA